jgi:toluene monooxygenase system ferredoxin subunit
MVSRKLCALDDLPPRGLVKLELDGRSLIAVRFDDDQVAVYHGRCPHQQMPLGDGHFDGRVLECAAHGWTFDLVTGRGVEPAYCFLARYPARIEGGEVWIEIRNADEYQR